MRIVLIRPPERNDINTRLPEKINRAKGILPPLGIAYIASYLRKHGYDVSILDCEALNLTADDIKEHLFSLGNSLNWQPFIVGITCMTSNFPQALKIAAIAKYCGAITVMGGPHVVAYPDLDYMYSCVDYTIVGEGEDQMLALVRYLDN